MAPLRRLRQWTLPAGVLATFLALAIAPLSIAHAAGSATIRDDAGLFTAAGRARITQAAHNANFNVVVITNAQPFPSKAAWRSWLKAQATDQNAVTIGLHFVPNQRNVYVVPGSNTGLSQSQADQGVQQALPTFNSSQPGHVTGGVTQLIQTYQSMGATQPAPGGPGFGWLWPVIILAILAFVVLRLFGRSRRTFVPPGYAPGTGGMGGPFQGGYGPGMGGIGGGAGRGFLGGLLGGLGGAWIGNQIFGNRGDGGNVNAGGFDPNAGNMGPTDTPNADSPGNWTGAGDTSSADAGGWSGGDSSGGWSGGDSGGGDSGGGGWS